MPPLSPIQWRLFARAGPRCAHCGTRPAQDVDRADRNPGAAVPLYLHGRLQTCESRGTVHPRAAVRSSWAGAVAELLSTSCSFLLVLAAQSQTAMKMEMFENLMLRGGLYFV